MKFLGYDKVLCLSPHPDDIEYAMLGSMAKYKNTQFDIFVLSEGGDFDATSSKARHDECYKVLEHFDNVKLEFSNIKFVKDKEEDEWVNIIETKYDIKKYDCIFVPPAEDSHFDHRTINKLSRALVRFDKCGVISYRTPSTLDKWIPNYFVDLNHIGNRNEKDGHSNGTHMTFLASTWFLKINRLKLFESQQGKPYFEEGSLNSFHSNYGCSKRGMAHTESFRIEVTYN
tara:strand:- start:287 stop:973 length:687 start_codon:yes stop_codon:yes gene_type:complete